MQKFSLHYHSFVLIMALYHSVRKIILCWLAAAVTEITTQQYYFQHFRNMLHECPCNISVSEFCKTRASFELFTLKGQLNTRKKDRIAYNFSLFHEYLNMNGIKKKFPFPKKNICYY